MPKKTTPYTYKQEDNPIDLAKRFAIPPDALLSANPGGYPFDAGQVINIPQTSPYFQSEKAPTSPTWSGLIPNAFEPQYNQALNMAGVPVVGGVSGSTQVGTPISIYARNMAQQYGVSAPVGYGPYWQQKAQQRANAPSYFTTEKQGAPSIYGTDDSWYAPAAPVQTQTGIQPTPAGNTDFNMTQAAQYNARNNIPFLQQKRWDPQRRKYITVGEWLRRSQGQHRRDRRARNQANNAQAQEQQQVDYTLANSLVSFGVSAG